MIKGDWPAIELGNPTWQTIAAWARGRVHELREQREKSDTDLRKLDIALGGIQQLNELLELPAAIKRERARDPILGEGFDIPPPKHGY